MIEFVLKLFSFVIFNSLQFKFKDNFNENLVGMSVFSNETETFDTETVWKLKFNKLNISYENKYFRFRYFTHVDNRAGVNSLWELETIFTSLFTNSANKRS